MKPQSQFSLVATKQAYDKSQKKTTIKAMQQQIEQSDEDDDENKDFDDDIKLQFEETNAKSLK